MIDLLERAGERLLSRVVPSMTALAKPCDCDTRGNRTVYCYCSGGRVYQKKLYCAAGTLRLNQGGRGTGRPGPLLALGAACAAVRVPAGRRHGAFPYRGAEDPCLS